MVSARINPSTNPGRKNQRVVNCFMISPRSQCNRLLAAMSTLLCHHPLQLRTNSIQRSDNTPVYVTDKFSHSLPVFGTQHFSISADIALFVLCDPKQVFHLFDLLFVDINVFILCLTVMPSNGMAVFSLVFSCVVLRCFLGFIERDFIERGKVGEGNTIEEHDVNKDKDKRWWRKQKRFSFNIFTIFRFIAMLHDSVADVNISFRHTESLHVIIFQ